MIKTLKELQKLVQSNIVKQQTGFFQRLQDKPFGYGILKNINNKISKQNGIAVSITLWVFQPRSEYRNQSLIMRNYFTILFSDFYNPSRNNFNTSSYG